MRSFFHFGLYFSAFLGILSLALIFFFAFVSKSKWGILCGAFLFFTVFGIIRFSLADVSPPEIFQKSLGEKISLEGEIIDEPSVAENNQKITAEAEYSGEKTKILIAADKNQILSYGDRIKFEGKLEMPENFETDQGKDFDYINYLRKDGIYFIMKYPKIEIVSSGNGNFLKNPLFYIKDKFLEKINLAIREPESLLMGGLILGEKSSFDESLRQSFVNTGTIHIVALSGYNVTIVAEWVMKIFSGLPRNFGLLSGVATILLFVLMTGGSSTAVRAGIMATLALLARLTGRNYDIGRALILALVFMVFFNPFILAFDVSFELSFIATVAVVFFTPRIEKYFLFIPERFGLRETVSVTGAAYIFVLPFILYKMGNLSLVALPANILILPFIPTTMMFGFWTGLAGMFSYFLSVPIGFVSYLFLHYELSVIAFFSNLPFASLSIPDFPLVFTLLVYAYFTYFLFGRSIRSFFTELF